MDDEYCQMSDWFSVSSVEKRLGLPDIVIHWQPFQWRGRKGTQFTVPSTDRKVNSIHTYIYVM